MAEPTAPEVLAKQVNTATLRALAATPSPHKVDALYGPSQAPFGSMRHKVQHGGDDHLSVRLPTPTAQGITTDLRGATDSAAFYLRFHNPTLVTRANSVTSLKLHDLFEQVRCDALGAALYVGARQNILQTLETQCRRKGYDTPTTDISVEDSLCLQAYAHLLEAELPPLASHVAAQWQPWVTHVLGAMSFASLRPLLHNQQAYGQEVARLLHKLDLQEIEQADPASSDSEKTPSASGVPDGEEQADPQSLPPQDATPTRSERAGMEDDTPQGLEEDDFENAGGETPAGQSEETDEAPLSGQGSAPYRAGYQSFAPKHDEVVDASALTTPEELSQLRLKLDTEVQPLQALIGRLANRLQRRLQAQQRRAWQFDVEDGYLDPARLARVVANPFEPLSFRIEKEAPFKDTVVTLLLDNSGSMRGKPITIAALSADILARALERCGVKVEILGFTTTSWKGGKSREDWVSAGRPHNPGRLNDVRHIIYKAADAPWRRTRTNLGLMLKEGILKENIDGEALDWAHKRLLKRTEKRRILLVVSDGAPVDDATLSANHSSFLEDDLRAVITYIEHKGVVELAAIGIGHDVSKYYAKAVTIRDAEELGQTLTTTLSSLFETPLGQYT